MDANDLLAKDPDIEFTYESDDGTRRSWLDHVCIFQCTAENSQNIYSV